MDRVSKREGINNEFFSKLLGFWRALHLGEFCDRLFDQRVEAGAAFGKMRENFGAHPRVPEFHDVAGHAVDGLGMRPDRKKHADLIGHMDEFVRRHGGMFRQPIVRGG
jgi:hypothetical protein